MTTYSFSDLEQIWINNGGSAIMAPMAAAIAMAESGGNSDAIGRNSNGSLDKGLWQINTSNGALSTTDINGNARAAIQISNNGSNWRPWCTAFSDSSCGSKGGSFLGLGSPYQKFLSGGSSQAGQSQIQTTAQVTSGKAGCALPWNITIPVIGSSLSSGCLWYDSWSRGILGGLFILGGLIFTVVGATMLAENNPDIRAMTKQVIGSAIKVAAIA